MNGGFFSRMQIFSLSPFPIYQRDLLRLLRPSWKGKSQQHRAKSSPSDFLVHGVSLTLTLPQSGRELVLRLVEGVILLISL